jgi:acetyl-CoA carboxylase beta subunit
MTRVFKHTWSLRKRFFYKCMECDAVAYEPDLRENLRIPFQCLWGASES